MSTDDALKEAMHQVAQAKVAEALGGDVLGKMVDAVMNHRSRNYSSARDNTRTALEEIVDELLRDLIRDAVRDHLAGRSEEIKVAVARALAASGADQFAASIIDAFATESWKASLVVKLDRRDDA